MKSLKYHAALTRRELWEHRSLWLVPAIIAGIMLLIVLWGAAALIWAGANGVVITHQGDNRPGGISDAVIGAAVPFNVALVLLVLFYLLDALYADRRDRSVLFWRSLPVSDTATVLSKLFTAMAVAPAIAFAAILAYEIVGGLVIGAGGLIAGINLFAELFRPGEILLAWLTLALAFLVQSLWLAPYYGWCLLCSAWAKKLPLAWAVLVPLGAMALEGIALHTHYLADGIFGHFVRWFGLLRGREGYLTGALESGRAFAPHGVLMSFATVAGYLLRPELWIGVIIGAVFVAGAVWLRRNRSEA